MCVKCYCYFEKGLRQRGHIEELIYCWSKGIIVTINGHSYSFFYDFETILQAFCDVDYMRSFIVDDVGNITQLHLDQVYAND